MTEPVADILDRLGIKLKSFASGRNHITTCPQCSGMRSKHDVPCLSVMIGPGQLKRGWLEHGVAYACHHCGWRGIDRGRDDHVGRENRNPPGGKGARRRAARETWRRKYA